MADKINRTDQGAVQIEEIGLIVFQIPPLFNYNIGIWYNFRVIFVDRKKNSVKAISSVSVRCPAKINFYLNTLKKRPDGFHEIESIFHAVSLYDKIVLNRSQGNSGKGLQITLSSDSSLQMSHCNKSFLTENILVDVYNYFRKHFKIPEVIVRLSKHIPIGAGLGGGSSDAAGFMLGLNHLFKLNLSKSELTKIGAGFGSDVPFFFTGGMAWVRGRGEIIEKNPLSLNQKILLLYPDRLLKTAYSYGKLNTINPRKSIKKLREEIKFMDYSSVIGQKKVEMFSLLGKHLFNSFEKKTLIAFDDLRKIKYLLKKKSDFCLMSGSGSSFFALFHDIITLQSVYNELRRDFSHTHIVRLVSSGVKISGN